MDVNFWAFAAGRHVASEIAGMSLERDRRVKRDRARQFLAIAGGYVRPALPDELGQWTIVCDLFRGPPNRGDYDEALIDACEAVLVALPPKEPTP